MKPLHKMFNRAARVSKRSASSLLMALAVAAGTASLSAQAGESDLLSRIGTNLMCTCPCSHALGQCGDECGEAPQQFAEIKNLLAGGKSEQEIYRIYEKRYGAKILAVPKAEGFNLLAWILPFVGVVVGLVVVVTVVKRLKPEEAPPEKMQRVEVDDKYRKLLEKELQQ